MSVVRGMKSSSKAIHEPHIQTNDLWLKCLESERFKTSPDATDEAIVLTVQELNWLLDGFDLAG